MRLQRKLRNVLNLSYCLIALAGCSHRTLPALSPLSQLDYEFVHPNDYQLEKISSKLRLAAYAEGYTLPPELKPLVIKEFKPVAFSLSSGEIIISDGLLTAITDEAQLAAIVAHEYSHNLLKHFSNLQGSSTVNMAMQPKLELAADELSLKLLQEAGYPQLAALKALRNLHRRIRGEVSSDWNELLARREENLASLINE